MSTELVKKESKSLVKKEEGGKRADVKQFVTFWLGNERYAFSVEHVAEIFKNKPITRIPYAPSFLPGVINLRGTIVTILDLREQFGIASSTSREQTNIIYISYKEYDVGLVVDQVIGVMEFSPDEIEPPVESVLTGIDISFIEGTGKKNGDLYSIINLEKYIAYTEEIVRETHRSAQ